MNPAEAGRYRTFSDAIWFDEECIMNTSEFIPYKEAKRIVSEVVEMEHPQEGGRRIFNVYNHRGEAICWFYADEVEAEVDAAEFNEIQEHLLHFIPAWAI